MNNYKQKHFVPGELSVEFIQFKNKPGGFKVGKITFPFAIVEVKDKWLENFDIGKYSGFFWLSKLFIKAIPTRNGGTFNVMSGEVPEYQIEESVELDNMQDLSQHSIVDFECNDPADDDTNQQQPVQAVAKQQQPAQPIAKQQQPAQPIAKQQQPAQPIAKQQQPVQPVANQQQPVQPVAKQQQPAQQEPINDADNVIFLVTRKYRNQSEIPDQYDPDMSIDRKLLRQFFNIINVTKDGQFKFNGKDQKWVRQAQN
jgi:hypothetical protein